QIFCRRGDLAAIGAHRAPWVWYVTGTSALIGSNRREVAPPTGRAISKFFVGGAPGRRTASPRRRPLGRPVGLVYDRLLSAQADSNRREVAPPTMRAISKVFCRRGDLAATAAVRAPWG